MADKSKFLLATGAVCVLALTGCGGGGGGGGGGEETSAAPVEAPDDYTLDTAESTLAATKVGDEQVSEVEPAGEAMASGGEEVDSATSMIDAMMAMIETDPEACKDPLFTVVSAGVIDGEGMSPELEQMVGGTTDSDLTISVRVTDSRDAADQAVKDLNSGLGDCGEVTLSAMGDEQSMTAETTSPEVEGAGETLILTGSSASSTSSASPSGDTTYSASAMSVGNLVIMASQGDGLSAVEGGSGSDASEPASEEDLESAMNDVAKSFVDGPVESTEGASESASPSES
ncbi:hypothetical protein EDL96_09755 [Kocuria soli]|uniref:Uncharacterized protein n=1 Tax=Kocuria soli TaxID=2485125 RepID=A0A3N3ZQF8_9MICC|nr:hypothetical protein [Kocuria soli]ROZ62465.1 hypothetical protein EDL96_09755 [Kocuria soli]